MSHAEAQALARIAGARERDAANVVAQAEAFDAHQLVSLAAVHGLSPLAHRALGALLDRDAASGLQERARREGERSALLAADMLEVEATLRDREVIAIPFKGPALASRLYGNVALRPSVDLDFLVRSDDVARAAAALGDAGFVGVPSSREIRMLQRSGNELGVVRAMDGLIVEVQWAPAPPYFSIPLRFDPMVDMATRIAFSGQLVCRLRPEDELLLLLVHGAKHLWDRLIWLADIVRSLLSDEPMDWDGVLRPARDARVTRMVLVGLRLALDLRPELPVPIEVRAAITRDSQVEEVARRVKQRLLTYEPRHPASPFRWTDLSLREDWRDKVTYCVRLAGQPTIRDLRWLPLPEDYWWAYPLVRPFRLSARYIRVARGASTKSDLG